MCPVIHTKHWFHISNSKITRTNGLQYVAMPPLLCCPFDAHHRHFIFSICIAAVINRRMLTLTIRLSRFGSSEAIELSSRGNIFTPSRNDKLHIDARMPVQLYFICANGKFRKNFSKKTNSYNDLSIDLRKIFSFLAETNWSSKQRKTSVHGM